MNEPGCLDDSSQTQIADTLEDESVPNLVKLASNSPFIDLDHPVTRYEAIKLVVLFPLACLRSILLVVVLLITWGFCRLAVLGHHHKEGNPLNNVRFLVVDQAVRFGSRAFVFLAGFLWISVKGKENLRKAKKARSILVFNHVSYVDPAMLLTQIRSSGVSKSGVADLPFVGAIAVALQFLFIARKGTLDHVNQYTVRSDPQTAVMTRARDTGYPLLALAPEATTKPKECLLKFRKGAFVPGKPVSPILFRYPCRHFHPGWGSVNTLFHIWRLLSQFVNHVEVEILPPYHPSEEEERDPVLYAENVRRLMASKLGIPMVDKDLKEELLFKKYCIQTDLWGRKVVAFGGQKKKSD